MISSKSMRVLLASLTLLGVSLSAHAQYQMERLSRGVVAVRTSSSQVYVGWRLFGNDPSDTPSMSGAVSVDAIVVRKGVVRME